jgi:hypothetical protein
MSESSIEKIEDVIVKAKPEEQRRLLANLPHLLKLSSSDMAILKLSEPAFDFWNNTDDVIYDSL